MRMFRDKARLPSPEQALPGRNQAMPVTNLHYVKGTPIHPPFPADTRTALFGLGCFWGAERCFWELPGVYSTAVGYAAPATRPTPRTRRPVLGAHGTQRGSW